MLYRDFQLSEDSCNLEVKYMNSPKMRGISCYDVEFRLIGENGLASVMLVQKGCYRLPGMIMGIRFVTKGSGAFDYVRLIDNQGELLFDDNFGK